MEDRYCVDFLVKTLSYTHGDNCKFTHAVFPGGFKENNAKVFEEHVDKTLGLSFVKKTPSDKNMS